MLRTLIKARVYALFSSIFRGTRVKRKRAPLLKALTGLLALFVIGNFLMLLGSLFGAICQPLHMAGLDWLYFSLAGMIAFAFILIGGVPMAQSQLFEAKDNELLLSMPIPPRLILISRMALLLAADYIVEGCVVVPAGAVYCMNAPVSVSGVLYFVAAFLFLPLLAMSFSCLFGWLLALISSRVRNKSLVVTTLSVGLLLLYFYAFSQMNGYISHLIAHGVAIADAIRRALFPAYHLGNAVAGKDPVSLLLFILCTVAPFIAAVWIVSANFIRIVTTRPGSVKTAYREMPLKVSGAMTALVRKEIRHFFSSPMYILNTALGVIFTFIFPIAMLVKRDLLAVLFEGNIPAIAEMRGPIVLLMLSGISATNIISAPSISLEGKNLWIAQSIPIAGSDVLLSKAYAHMILCLPSVAFAAAVLNAILDLSMGMRILLFATPALLTVFAALFGVAVNLRFPKFDWINETTAIKRGLSTMVAMFGSMAVVGGTAALYAFKLHGKADVETFTVLFSLLLAAANAGLYAFLKTKGSEAFAALHL